MLSTHLLLGLVLVVASLNRETGVLLVIGHGCMCLVYHRPRLLVWTVIYSGLWAACTVGVRLAMGPGDTYWTLPMITQENVRRLPESVMHLLILFGGLWWLAGKGLRKLPRFHQALIPVVVVSLVLIAVFGIWSEMRLLVPLYPLILSYGLHGLAQQGER